MNDLPNRARPPRAAVWTVALGAALVLAATACGGGGSAASSSPSTSPVAPATSTTAPPATSTTTTSGSDLSGTWSGTYSGTFSGTFTLKWTQTSSKLSGKIDLSTSGTVPVNGTITGNSIKFGTVGSTAVTYTGTVSGSSMSGNYNTPSGGGTWSAHKTS